MMGLLLLKFGLSLICVFFAATILYIVWIAYIMGKETFGRDNEEDTNQGLAIDLKKNEWKTGKVRPGWRMRNK